jgi:Domain of unknown function (DUF4270)
LQQSSIVNKVAYIDTLTVTTQNTILDSLPLDPLNLFSASQTQFNLLVGVYDNMNFGKVTVSSYVQFSTYSGIPTLDNSYVCDSVVLALYYNYNYANGNFPYDIYDAGAVKYYNSYTCGDTTQPFRMRIYEPLDYLPTTITEPTTKSPIHGQNDIQWGDAVFIPSSLVDSATPTAIQYVHLNTQLGTRIMQNIIADPNFAANFSSYFNGLVLETDPSNTAVLGFAAADPAGLEGPFLTVYYHNAADTGSVIFTSPSGGLAVNHITSNRSSSVYLSSLQSPSPAFLWYNPLANPLDSISTSATGNLGFIQAGSGLSVKISLPTFSDFVNSSKDKLIITNAYLVVTRSSIFNIDDGGPDHKLPPPYLTLYQVYEGQPCKYYSPGNAPSISNPPSTNNPPPVNVWATIPSDGLNYPATNPIRGMYNYATQSYTLDLTIYLQQLSFTNQEPKFILTAGYNNQAVNGLIFGDAKNTDHPIKLLLYYTRVKL